MVKKSKLTDEALLSSARDAKAHAVAPYSRFKVGAAVVSADGDLFTGCNIENASYGLTMCAERVAIFSAIANGARKIDRLAVSTDGSKSGASETNMPCGACRQVMSEFMDAHATVTIDGVGTFTLAELLPAPFRLDRR